LIKQSYKKIGQNNRLGNPITENYILKVVYWKLNALLQSNARYLSIFALARGF
jgi:hypothetical protein